MSNVFTAITVENSQIIDEMNSFELSFVLVREHSIALLKNILIQVLPLTIKKNYTITIIIGIITNKIFFSPVGKFIYLFLKLVKPLIIR